jgi:hypothetical protein
MRWITALILGAILGFTLPMTLGGHSGIWANSWTNYGTIRPFTQSPGLMFSIPVFLLSAVAFRMFFNWHKG